MSSLDEQFGLFVPKLKAFFYAFVCFVFLCDQNNITRSRICKKNKVSYVLPLYCDSNGLFLRRVLMGSFSSALHLSCNLTRK